MSAYEIKLHYDEVLPGEGVPGQTGYIIARGPTQESEFPICPPCVSYVEIKHEIDRLRKALDSVDWEAKRRFGGHGKKVRAASQS